MRLDKFREREEKRAARQRDNRPTAANMMEDTWPLPWRLEEDWCYEIKAANGSIVLKLPYPSMKWQDIAQRIIDAANSYASTPQVE